jgi:hypothetical protein
VVRVEFAEPPVRLLHEVKRVFESRHCFEEPLLLPIAEYLRSRCQTDGVCWKTTVPALPVWKTICGLKKFVLPVGTEPPE